MRGLGFAGSKFDGWFLQGSGKGLNHLGSCWGSYKAPCSVESFLEFCLSLGFVQGRQPEACSVCSQGSSGSLLGQAARRGHQ